MTWIKDQYLWAAACVATVLRTVPMAVWMEWPCTRDECTYIRMARRIADGDGIEPMVGWLWAPAYPWIMSLFYRAFGYASTVKGLQVVAAVFTLALLYRLTQRSFGQRAGRIAAWVYALHPVMAFFSMSLWSESLYSTLLLALLLAFGNARDHHDDSTGRRALLWAAQTGALVGLCVLFRGVATYMLPVLVFAMLWRRLRASRAWAQTGIMVAAAVIVVAPYSVHATLKHEATIITDRTLGQMMWLGNNEFSPMTFDYGNGALSNRAYGRHISLGRGRCAPRSKAMDRDTCETEAGKEWIRANPGEFARRMPLRVAQLMHPHSLMTRHLRWGRWKGLPQWADEVIVVAGAATSLGIMWLGTLGLAARGRGARGVLIFGILLYHVAAISVLAGLSRYRVPLEPLLLIYAAAVAADPKGAWQQLRTTPWRAGAAIVLLGLVVPLSLWFLPAGWPGWRTW